jgi:hypothetical protein
VATDRDDRRLAAPGGLELIRDFINTLDVLPDTDKIGDPPEDRGEHPGHNVTVRNTSVRRLSFTVHTLLAFPSAIISQGPTSLQARVYTGSKH